MAASRVAALIVNQVASRGITFILNVAVARTVGTAIFGLQAVNLYLLYTTILFVAREGVRRATLRPIAGIAPRLARQLIINLSFLSVLASIPIAIVLSILFLRVPPSAEAIRLGYSIAVPIYAIAAVIEMVGEPLYVVAQRRVLVRARVVIETVAVIIRCIITYMGVTYGTIGNTSYLMAFAYGQLAYSVMVTIGFVFYFSAEIIRNGVLPAAAPAAAPAPPVVAAGQHDDRGWEFTSVRDFMPDYDLVGIGRSSGGGSGTLLVANTDVRRLSWAYTWQSLLKLLLTEGEKMVLVSLPSIFQLLGWTLTLSLLDDQGIYALVSNLGSLVCRLLFQPIEEASATEFAQLLPRHILREGAAAAGAADVPAANIVAANIERSRRMIFTQTSIAAILKLVLLISSILVTFGSNYSQLFFSLLYGNKWSGTDAPRMLSYYCVYIALLAVNGVTEAFISAVISVQQLAHQSKWLVIFSLLYIVMCAILSPYGGIGLLAANGINMILRISYSLLFISEFMMYNNNVVHYQHMQSIIRSTAFHPLVIAALALSWGITALSASYFSSSSSNSGTLVWRHVLTHIGVGCICVVLTIITIWRSERTFFASLRAIRRGHQD